MYLLLKLALVVWGLVLKAAATAACLVMVTGVAAVLMEVVAVPAIVAAPALAVV
jgi:hypothetical protein